MQWIKLASACVVWGALAAVAPVVHAAEAASVEVIDAKNLSGIKRVAVASFMVQYVVAQEATSKGGASSGIDFTAQLDKARLQDTTEALYQEFLKKVQASGLELVAPQDLAALPAFKKMLEVSPPAPHSESTWSRGKGGGYNSVLMSAKGLPLVLHDDIDHLMDGWSHVGDPTISFTGQFAVRATNWPYYDKDLQKDAAAATLHVRIFVPLAVTSTNTWMAANWQRDRSTTTAALRIGERLTRMGVGNNGSYAKVALKNGLFIEGVVGESNAPKPGLTLSGFLFGNKDNSANFSLNVDGYFNEVSAAAGSVMDSFIGKLR